MSAVVGKGKELVISRLQRQYLYLEGGHSLTQRKKPNPNRSLLWTGAYMRPCKAEPRRARKMNSSTWGKAGGQLVRIAKLEEKNPNLSTYDVRSKRSLFHVA